jgi:hypothetical protein
MPIYLIVGPCAYVQDGRYVRQRRPGVEVELDEQTAAKLGVAVTLKRRQRSKPKPEPEPEEVEIEEEEVPLEGWTVGELKDALDEAGAEYRASARKAELIELLQDVGDGDA